MGRITNVSFFFKDFERFRCAHEAAFVSSRMYLAGVWPVAQQKYTCTVLTTTPGGDQSYIMQQARKVDAQGNPLMPCLLLGDPCAQCKAKNEYICAHTTEKGPFWKSTTKRTQFGFFYENDQETNARENYNASFEAVNHGFLPQYVESLSRRERFKDLNRPRWVTVAADAAGGGKDEFAIVGGYSVGRKFVITFMDAERVPGGNLTTVKDRLFYAFARVRSFELFRDIPILFIPENAPGPIGPTFVYLIDQEKHEGNPHVNNIFTMVECGKARGGGATIPGVPKTKEITDQMVRFAGARLAAGDIVFSANLRAGQKTVEQAMIDKLLRQMSGFRCATKINRGDEMADPKFKWLGDQDDLLVAVMTAMYWEDYFVKSPRKDYVEQKVKWRIA